MPPLPLWAVAHFLVAALGTWLARHYALRRQLLDQPGERRSHSTVTPRGGGIGIVAALLLGVGWLAFVPAQSHRESMGFGIGLVLVAGIGWLDDHRPLSPWPRLAVHAVAAALLAWSTWRGGGAWWLALAAFLAAMALTNIWNFMDGIDGIAASQAMIAAVSVVPLLRGSPPGWLALALFAACCGFLPFNFPRARIFLGDVGSGALGYALAALLSSAAMRSPPASPLLLLPLMPFMVDAGLTLASRILRGERWWTPHVEHAYQRLARRCGHVPVTLGYACVGVLGAGIGWVLLGDSSFNRLATVVVWYGFGIAAWFVARHRTLQA